MNLENYTPKGELKEFPIEIIQKMLDYQIKQGNKEDISVFESIYIMYSAIYGRYSTK